MNFSCVEELQAYKSYEISEKLRLINSHSEEVKKFLMDYSQNKIFSISLRNTPLLHSDCQFGLALNFENQFLAAVGVSAGMGNYYSEEVLNRNYPDLEKIILASGSEFVVNLMQSVKGKKDERANLLKNEIDYRTELMRCLDEVFSNFFSPIHFYLPGKFVYWNLPPMKGYCALGTPLESILRKNYDKVAKNFGFRFNPKSNLYER